MQCPKCNEYIEADSKFCQFCGHKLGSNDSKAEADIMWRKFIEYSYNTDLEKRNEQRKQRPEQIADLINRFSNNLFNTLKEENPQVLELPYKETENIKNNYYFAAEDGFWLFLTNKELKHEKINVRENLDTEKIVEAWQKSLENTELIKRHLNDAIAMVLETNQNVTMDNLLKNNEGMTNLPAKIIENIKSDLFKMTLWVFMCCELAEGL
jgi:LEA14-like dessication related protein